jgi:hypothetical protein
MPEQVKQPSRRRWALVGTLAVLGATTGVRAQPAAQPDPMPSDVWIELSEPVAAGAPSAEEAKRRRLRVSAQQARVAQRLRELGVTELGRTAHTRNAILVRIAPQQNEAVLQIDGVRRLRPSRALHPPKPMP